MLDGLLLHEIILMVLGIPLFIVAIATGVYYVRHDKDLKAIVGLLGLSIAMIGYSSIQKINIMQGLVEIEKKTDQVAQNPDNDQAREDLRNSLQKIDERPITNPGGALVIAQGFKVLNERDDAVRVLDRAIQKHPKSTQLTTYRQRIAPR